MGAVLKIQLLAYKGRLLQLLNKVHVLKAEIPAVLYLGRSQHASWPAGWVLRLGPHIAMYKLAVGLVMNRLPGEHSGRESSSSPKQMT